ncbi:PREDICTED: synaptic vesicle glycoprotein 2C-like [Branchiostoma belcheri]|uniref:Synaptic vesicle glycoprotein 2C-like n=1 Tax=Branchiostoma belcheri TaxID=7741 RepID=A0A6P4XZ33_BRABE|nr:PREDICTED: synaptic vesicle glycoprotein 2C-like [Branchiostoma belcheri]
MANVASEKERLLDEKDEESFFPGDDSGRVQRSQDRATYEEAIAATGYGRFQYWLLFVCGWANASDAIEILCVSFLLPSATCDLKLTTTDKGWLSGVIFAGMMIGGYVWGALADVQGRRKVLMLSLLVNGLFGLASSMANSFLLFLFFRFLSGVGVGGSIPVVFAYYCEFQPKSKRGTMLSVLAASWMFGNIIAAGLAWLVIPRTYLQFSLGTMMYDSWRVFVALCTIPSLTAALLLTCMPESPKFLMEMGKEKEALRVLSRVHKMNTANGKTPRQYSVRQLEVATKKDDDKAPHLRGKTAWRVRCAEVGATFRVIVNQTVELVKPPLTSRTIVMMIIMFSICFGYYGLWLWLPELFKRIDLYGGSPCLESHKGVNGSAPPVPLNETCLPSEDVYFEGFLTAVSNLPGNIFATVLMHKLGAKILLSGSLFFSGVSVFLFWFVSSKTQSLIASCAFGGISVICFNSLDVLGAELYPTHLRSTAMGIQTGMGRIAAILGNVVFGLLVDTHCAIPLLMVASLLVIGGLAAIKLPNTKGTELH